MEDKFLASTAELMAYDILLGLSKASQLADPKYKLPGLGGIVGMLYVAGLTALRGLPSVWIKDQPYSLQQMIQSPLATLRRDMPETGNFRGVTIINTSGLKVPLRPPSPILKAEVQIPQVRQLNLDLPSDPQDYTTLVEALLELQLSREEFAQLRVLLMPPEDEFEPLGQLMLYLLMAGLTNNSFTTQTLWPALIDIMAYSGKNIFKVHSYKTIDVNTFTQGVRKRLGRNIPDQN